MPSIKELKSRGRKTLYDHFFYNVIVVFFAGLLVSGGYNYSTRTTMENTAIYETSQAVRSAAHKAGETAGSALSKKIESSVLSEKTRETSEKVAETRDKINEKVTATEDEFSSKTSDAEEKLYALGERYSNYDVLESVLRGSM